MIESVDPIGFPSGTEIESRGRDPWPARARRYRRDVADYCELCWYPGPRMFLWWWIGDRLEVHHRDGRHPDTLGHELDHQLQTLCQTCHRTITNRHQTRGRREGVTGGRNPARYSQIIREVTDNTRPRHLRRGWHRFLYGKPEGDMNGET